MGSAWLKTYTTAGDYNGRVNLDNVQTCQAYGGGSSWRAAAFYLASSGIGLSYISPTIFTSQADAVAAIDDLLLNGS